MPTIKLMSSDWKTLVVDVEVARRIPTIKTMLDDLEKERVGKGCWAMTWRKVGKEQVIPVPPVNASILEKVISWVTRHKEGLQRVGQGADEMEAWEADFLKVDLATLLELTLAAYYLGLKHLLQLTCGSVADMLRGKTPEEIRKVFNIKSDYTPAEEEGVRKENEWCEEK